VDTLDTQQAQELYEVFVTLLCGGQLLLISLVCLVWFLFFSYLLCSFANKQAESDLKVDYSSLDAELKRNKDRATEEGLLEQIKQVLTEIERAAPNMRAIDKSESLHHPPFSSRCLFLLCSCYCFLPSIFIFLFLFF